MVEEKKDTQDAGQEKTLTQTQVDAIVQERLARERAKFADYEDLRKFRTEHEQKLEQATQKELEAKKEYEKLKEGWTTKEKEYQGVISKKETEITDMRVSGALINEITKQNAYAEETMALLKSQAVFDKEGNIRVKGRDANGLEVLNSVEEGVKKFLEQRPHLVRVPQRTGAGTAASKTAGAGVADTDLVTLTQESMQAQQRGDFKKVKEINAKIRTALTSQGARK
jgi:YesN/AraC family two-component response regulator